MGTLRKWCPSAVGGQGGTSVEQFFFLDNVYLTNGFLNWLGYSSTCFQAVPIFLNSAVFLHGICKIILHAAEKVLASLS